MIPTLLWTCGCSWPATTTPYSRKHVGLADRTHPVQFLHTFKYVWTKSSLEHCRQARGYAGGVDGPWDRLPKDPNVGRWLYLSMAARHVIELREALEALDLTLHGLLVDMEDSEYAGKQSTREMWAYLADMCEDGRFVSFCVFEAEYAATTWTWR